VRNTSISIFIIYLFLYTTATSQNLTLKIFGNDTIESQVIDSIGYLKNHKNFTSINSEIDSIQNKLFKLGYIENESSKIEKENDSSFLAKIDLKKKYYTIYIYYDKTNLSKSLLNSVSKKVYVDYFELPISKIESSLNFINAEISNKGFPFAKLSLTNIQLDNDGILKADLTLNSQTEKRNINSIIIKGYEKFSKSYLKHYLKIKPNQIFDLKTLKEKTEQLNNLRFAKQIKSPEVLFTKDSTTLYVYVEKTKSNTFDGFLGFGTNEQTNKLDFNGYLNLNLINTLNYGESFSLQYKSTESSQKLFQAEINMPYIVNTPVGLDLQLHIFKQDSSFTTVNQSLKLNYQINSKHKLYTGIKSTESNNLLNTNSYLAVSDYKSNYFTLGYEFTKPHYYNLLFPVNSKLYIESGFGKRKNSDTSEKQTQLYLDAFNIFNLNEKNSIYLRFNGSSLLSDNYFENELYRFGGINSIRGFEENSILATSYGIINTEYRLQLSSTIYIHSIIDVASFENKITDTKEKLYAYGFGFGIKSNAGLLKLNFANGKTNTQKFKFSNSQVHLSLSAVF
jgi:outer membrane protein assembly factor BamA